jgi:hypothetical protein
MTRAGDPHRASRSDGNVAGGRVLLQVTQHGPAEHVGQEDVERDSPTADTRASDAMLHRPRGAISTLNAVLAAPCPPQDTAA